MSIAISRALKGDIPEDIHTLVGTYGYSQIAELTYNTEPFLLSSEAFAFGKDVETDDFNFNEVMTISMVTEDDCAGHFGPKVPKGPRNLKIPLLHLSRIMSTTAQIAAREICPEAIPLLIGGKNVRANSPKLMSPPATVVAVATNFRINGSQFIADTTTRSSGNPFATINDLTFELIPADELAGRRTVCSNGHVPDELMAGYVLEREMYRSEIEELIMEREPFHRLDQAILLRSEAGDLKVITISRVTEADCEGQLSLDGRSTLSLIDYSRLMALTAELLASIVTRERFDGYEVVPIAVKSKEVSTPNLVLLSPPTTVVVEASISVANLNNPRKLKRGRELFWADYASAFVDEIEVARMDEITYALVPEEGFFE